MDYKILSKHNSIWLIVVILFFFSPFDYTVRFEIFVILLIYLILGNFTFRLGHSIRFKRNKYKSIKNINLLFKLIILFSSIYFIALLIKFNALSSTYEFSYSLSGFTTLRVSQEISNYEMGANISGIIASFFSGWPMLLIPFYYHFCKTLTKIKKYLIFTIIALYTISTLSSGGRNGIIIIFLILYLSVLFNKNKFKLKLVHMAAFIIIFVVVYIIISQIFLDRVMLSHGELYSYVKYIENYSPVRLKTYSLILLENNLKLYFPIFLLHEYLVHGIFEFQKIVDFTSNSQIYFGQYNFYFVFLLFNKLGLEFTSINEILNQLPNPGRYLTLYGMLMIDFGKYLIIIIISLIYFLTGYFIKLFKISNSFEHKIISIYFTCIIFMSPIYSLIGTSIFPSFLTAIITLGFLKKIGFLK